MAPRTASNLSLTEGDPALARPTGVLSEASPLRSSAEDRARPGFWEWNLQSDEIVVSPDWLDVLGPHGKAGRRRSAEWFERVHPEDREAFDAEMLAHLEGRVSEFESSYRLRYHDEIYRQVLCRGRALRTGTGEVHRISGSQHELVGSPTRPQIRHQAAPVDSLPRAPRSEKDEVLTRSGSRVRGSETILLVEDNEVVRMVVAEVLKANGYRVLQASNGNDAMDRFSSTPETPDLVVTDVVMPRMGGIELARRLKASNPGLQMLFMSGQGELGCPRGIEPTEPYLRKPFSPRDLVAKVREILDRPPGTREGDDSGKAAAARPTNEGTRSSSPPLRGMAACGPSFAPRPSFAH